MDVKKHLLPLPLAAVIALVPACPAMAGSSKGGKSTGANARDTYSQAYAHGAGRKVH